MKKSIRKKNFVKKLFLFFVFYSGFICVSVVNGKSRLFSDCTSASEKVESIRLDFRNLRDSGVLDLYEGESIESKIREVEFVLKEKSNCLGKLDRAVLKECKRVLEELKIKGSFWLRVKKLLKSVPTSLNKYSKLVVASILVTFLGFVLRDTRKREDLRKFFIRSWGNISSQVVRSRDLVRLNFWEEQLKSLVRSSFGMLELKEYQLSRNILVLDKFMLFRDLSPRFSDLIPGGFKFFTVQGLLSHVDPGLAFFPSLGLPNLLNQVEFFAFLERKDVREVEEYLRQIHYKMSQAEQGTPRFKLFIFLYDFLNQILKFFKQQTGVTPVSPDESVEPCRRERIVR